METYARNKAYWENVFDRKTARKIGLSDVDKHPEAFAEGLRWLCRDSESLLDFGCGNGVILMQCALLGTRNHIGIDLSENAVSLARQYAALHPAARFDFLTGDVTRLKEIADQSMDGIIASNIIDNLTPEDAQCAITEIHRILKKHRKLLLKVNDYLTEEQIRAWNIKPIRGNFLDDGLFLWNLTTGEWQELLSPYFLEVEQINVHYPQHEMYNRLFLLENKG